MGLFDQFRQGLQKTTRLLKTDVRDLFKAEGRLVDEKLLDELLEAKHKPVSKWYPLGEKTQRSGGDGSRGSLQVIAQWRYNKDLDFEPFSAV